MTTQKHRNTETQKTQKHRNTKKAMCKSTRSKKIRKDEQLLPNHKNILNRNIVLSFKKLACNIGNQPSNYAGTKKENSKLGKKSTLSCF